jgi:hypothetical protein
MNECKCSTVFINSKNRLSGEMHDFTINFEDNTIVADKDTSIRLNVVGVVMKGHGIQQRIFILLF